MKMTTTFVLPLYLHLVITFHFADQGGVATIIIAQWTTDRDTKDGMGGGCERIFRIGHKRDTFLLFFSPFLKKLCKTDNWKMGYWLHDISLHVYLI